MTTDHKHAGTVSYVSYTPVWVCADDCPACAENTHELAEIAALHDAAPAMYRALKAISSNEWIMLDVFSQATRQLVREAIRQAEAR